MGKLRPRSYSTYARSELNCAATELFHSSPSKAPTPSVIARALETPEEDDGPATRQQVVVSVRRARSGRRQERDGDRKEQRGDAREQSARSG